MERMTAECAENAWISRNWKSDEFSEGEKLGLILNHVAPALVVRRTVPFVPLTQTTLLETGDKPRNCWVEFVGVSVHVRGLCEGPGCAVARVKKKKGRRFMMMACGKMRECGSSGL
jgi:hypothetical protein